VRSARSALGRWDADRRRRASRWEIASFLAGWVVGRVGASPGSSPADRRPGPAHDQATSDRNGNTLHASEWFSLAALSQGQHRARRGQNE
jgi:hypothetical protein